MKRSINPVAVIIMLILIGVITFSYVTSHSQTVVKQYSTTPASVPTELVGFPDIASVPIYPHASITKAKNDSVTFRHIVYEVTDGTDSINAFYRDILPKNGWKYGGSKGQISMYTWSDASGTSPWHLYLKVVVGYTLDNSKSLVNLDYGRYPDTGDGLPRYPDAQQETVASSDIKRANSTGTVQVHVSNITYQSKSDPEEIAAFYNASMLDYGWTFYDSNTPGPSSDQTGSITSPEGLYFRSRYLDSNTQRKIADDLFITAEIQKSGLTLVTMRLEHSTY